VRADRRLAQPGAAKTIIRLSGRSEAEIEIRFSGLRPGEKLHEEVFTSDEPTDRTAHPSVRVARPRPVAIASLDARVGSLRPPVRVARHVVGNDYARPRLQRDPFGSA
jgi:FlaA1/EpsC-like NDP-sugar epimerase